MFTTSIIVIGNYNDAGAAESVGVLVAPLVGAAGICRRDEAKSGKTVRIFLTFNQKNGRSLLGGRDQLRQVIKNAANTF